MSIRTIVGALGAIARCATNGELRELSLTLGAVAWNDGGQIERALDERRTELADGVGPFVTLADATVWAETNGTLDWQWFDGHTTEALARYAYHQADGQSCDELLRGYLTARGEDPRDYAID